MMHAFLPRCARGLALALLPLTSAHAEVLIDNLNEPVKNPAPLNNAFWYAQSFLTPAGPTLQMDAVSARLGELDGTPGIVAELRADNAGTPGAVLKTFAIPALAAGPAATTGLTWAGVVELAPLSTYWLLLGVTGDGGYHWDYAAGNGATGSGSFHEYALSYDQTATWALFGTEGPLMMRVDVSPVPEPAAWLMLAAGLLLVAQRRRERQRKPV